MRSPSVCLLLREALMNTPSCRDCKHSFQESEFADGKLNCGRTKRRKDGVVFFDYVETRRADKRACGPSGRYFEPTLWVRVKRFFKRKEEK